MRHSSPPPPTRFKPLTEEEVQELARKMQETYKWPSPPYSHQLDGVRAQLEGVDTIIQAPTGSGKTAIAAGPHLWPGNEHKVTIMVSPLLSLEDEMVQTFKTDFGLDAVAINSKNGACSPRVVQAILARRYQIILLSPEMLQSRTFINRILRNTSFMRHVISLFVDEAHCISHWGADFRKKYSSLGTTRAFLARGTPVIAVTATLTDRVRRDIHSKLHFPKHGSMFVNVGNDRPNVSIVVRACEHPQNSFVDLDFVLPLTIHTPEDIPKTYIYVDNIQVGNDIIDHLTDLLRRRQVPNTIRAESSSHTTPIVSPSIIRPYNATLSNEYRTAAMAHFRTGDVRILVCTDAAGMGCDVPDIDLVIIWKLPATMSNYVQRAGRAARGRNRTGLAVLLVERATFSPSANPEPSSASIGTSRASKAKGKQKANASQQSTGSKTAAPEGSKAKSKANKEFAKAHGVSRGGSRKQDEVPSGEQPVVDPDTPDEGLRAFVKSTRCRREVWGQIYNSLIEQPATVPCCDICDPSLFDHTRPGLLAPQPKPKGTARGEPHHDTQIRLRAWRRMVFKRDHPLSQLDPTLILDDATLLHLCSIGQMTPTTMATILKPSWVWWDRYHAELLTFLEGLTIPFVAKPSTKRSITNSIIDAVFGSTSESQPRKRAKVSSSHTEASISAPSQPGSSQTSVPMPTHSPPQAVHATVSQPYGSSSFGNTNIHPTSQQHNATAAPYGYIPASAHPVRVLFPYTHVLQRLI
ncbi:P-loop containing nucleoside triphosphate hydrolase protein [Amylocystis lapponica]|nr:P-loop containing nucleoside triphosphate hydrolase protein [Amylocystis lapponica]